MREVEKKRKRGRERAMVETLLKNHTKKAEGVPVGEKVRKAVDIGKNKKMQRRVREREQQGGIKAGIENA